MGNIAQPFKFVARLILPQRAIFLLITFKDYWYDIKRYTRYSNTHYALDSANKFKGRLTLFYHVIEKGLTMPETRLGFGTKVVNNLIELCNLYLKAGHSVKDPVFVHSIKVLNEYLRYHEKRKYTLEPQIVSRIKKLASKVNILNASNQYEFTEKEFFQHHNASFDKFCISRHSARNFIEKEVPTDTIYHAIQLAMKSPSACNRQPNRVYVVKDRDKFNQLLKLQSGNRGFGHLANGIIVITSDISVFQNNDERKEASFNSGLFSMSLIYALHFYKIGACLLNWSTSVENDIKLRGLLKIPDNEVITVTIAFGHLPEKFKIAISPRLEAQEVTTLLV